MFKRMIQAISQLFTGGQLVPTSTQRPHSPDPLLTRRFAGGKVTTGLYTQSQMPPAMFPHPPLRVDRHSHPQRRDNPARYQNAMRLLQDGRLQIGVTGFHDAAFNVGIMDRYDAPQLVEAVADLPCRVKMVAQRNIADALLVALNALDTPEAGRRGIVLITSGESSVKEEWARELAETAAQRRIGIHVICLGPKSDDPTCGPRINTKNTLGYGGFRVVKTGDQLLAAVRDSFDGLTPAFGMKGTNKVVILVDCSETMVESYGNTTRIEMFIASLNEFLKDPLIRSYPVPWANNTLQNAHTIPRSRVPLGRGASDTFTPGPRPWTPRSA